MGHYDDEIETVNARRRRQMAEAAGFADADAMYARLAELRKEIESIPPADYTDTATLVKALRILEREDSPPTLIKLMDEFLMKRIIG